MFLWRLLLSDDIPTPAKGVYIYFEYIALGFVLVAIEEFVRHMSTWLVWSGCLVMGAMFLFIGIMGARVKSWLSLHRSSWLLFACTLIVCVAVGYDIYDRHRQQVNAGAAPNTGQPPNDADREFTTKPPLELLGFYRGRTALQADSLMKPFVGLWVNTEGTLIFLAGDGEGASAAAIRRLNDIGESPIDCRFPAKWTVAMSRISIGDIIKFQGKISPSQNGSQLYLSPCELLGNK